LGPTNFLNASLAGKDRRKSGSELRRAWATTNAEGAAARLAVRTLHPDAAQIHLRPLCLWRRRERPTQLALDRRGRASLQQIGHLFPTMPASAFQPVSLDGTQRHGLPSLRARYKFEPTECTTLPPDGRRVLVGDHYGLWLLELGPTGAGEATAALPESEP
jgi:hypothetical protein